MTSHHQSAQTLDIDPPVAGKILKNSLRLPTDFLKAPTPNIIASRIKFEKSAVPELEGLYATVLDNVLTPEECSILIQAVDNQSEDSWERIVGNDNADGQGFLSDNRKCRRMMWDSPELGSKIWKRIVDKVPEVQRLENWPEVTSSAPRQQKVWNMIRLNERIRFMKYGHGDYFKRSFPFTQYCFSGLQTSDRVVQLTTIAAMKHRTGRRDRISLCI